MIIAPDVIKTPHILLQHKTDNDEVFKSTRVSLKGVTLKEVSAIEDELSKLSFWADLMYKTTNGHDVDYTFNASIPLLPLYMTIAKIACAHAPENHKVDYMCIWDTAVVKENDDEKK